MRIGLDSIYLAKQLSTPPIVQYFARHASGSTRYGLSIGVIESAVIPSPPKLEQTKIAEILSTVDKALEQTKALIIKQRRIKTGLMQDLLTRGIDENGNLRAEGTHKFKDSPLGRIPAEWEVKRTGDVSHSLVPGRNKPVLDGGGIPWITIPDVENMYIESSKDGASLSLNAIKAANARLMPANTVLMSCVGEFGITTVTRRSVVANQQLHGFVCNKSILPEWLALQIEISGKRIDQMATQTTIKYLNKTGCESIEIMAPKKKEQARVLRVLDSWIDSLSRQEKQLLKLKSLKSALMQDLLTGKKRVTALLEPEAKGGGAYASL
jgi:type I restriction enzyme S subunit